MNIAITGKMRSGKDAIGRYLSEKHGYTRFAFGDELKRYANELFGVHDGGKRRELYQWFGQTMRERDPEIWVRKLFGKVEVIDAEEMYNSDPFSAVITDLRQPNEYDRCRSEGYVIIRVSAPDGTRIHRAIESADTFELSDLTHETESHVDSFEVDYEIVNDGTIEELYAKVDEVLAQISGHTEVAHL